MKISDTSAQDVHIEPRSPHRRRIVAGTAGVVLIGSILFAAPWVERWVNASVSVPYERIRTATVVRGDLVRDVSVQGRVVAAVSPTLYATESGTITLHADAGQQVVAGQD